MPVLHYTGYQEKIWEGIRVWTQSSDHGLTYADTILKQANIPAWQQL